MMMIERDVKRMQGVNDITCLKGLLDIRVSRNVNRKEVLYSIQQQKSGNAFSPCVGNATISYAWSKIATT